MIATTDNPADEWDLENVDPATLRKHELSIEIYGDERNEALIESIRKDGIRNTPRVNKDGTIIGGSTRIQSARILGMTRVAVLRHKTQLTDLEVRRQIILDNRETRERKPEIVDKEYQKLVEIEQAEAALRKESTQAKPGEKVGTRKVGENL